MLPHKLTICLFVIFLTSGSILAQRKPPAGGRLSIVVDERLAALRETARLDGRLVRRLTRGRMVAVRSQKTSAEGITFYLVNVSSRTYGWIQREAVVSPSRSGDDQRLFTLIERSQGFDRITRARIFLDHFQRSRFRPAVLLLIGGTAEELASILSRDASRRLKENIGDAPEFSYFLNYTGLDRYNRQGIKFVFNQSAKQFHYDGAAWRELISRYPQSSAALEGRKRLGALLSSAKDLN